MSAAQGAFDAAGNGGRIRCGEAGYLGGGFAPAGNWRIGCYASPLTQPVRIYQLLAHDPEKWEPVFGKDHAQAKC